MSFGKTDHYVWMEKYRPRILDDYVGGDHLKTMAKKWIAEKDIPHLLLYGPAGTGKTTLAKILTTAIPCDVLFINASDENSVDTIRNKLRGFAAGIGFSDLKIAVLDEADFVTPQGQAALRNLMETFSKTCRFILTANYRERIIDPIQSRCHQVEIVPPIRKDVAIRVASILTAEGITFKPKDVALIVDAHYPDIRGVLNELQGHVIDDELKVEAKQIAESDYKTHILGVLTDNTANPKQKFQSIRQIIADARVRDFAPLYRLLFDKVDQICPKNISMAIVAIAEGQRDDVMVVDHEINMMATLINVLRLQ